MENIVKLMHDISDAEGHTAQIESDVKTIDKELIEIHDDLEVSEKINKSLHTLDTSLGMASELLTIVGIIPEISTEASALKRSIDTFHKPIKEAVEESDAVEKTVKPVREKIGAIEPKVKKVDAVLLDTMNKENQFVDILGSAEHCINSLPDSVVKSKLEEQMEAASSTMDPMVLKFDSVQVELLDSVEEAKKQADKIKSWAQGLIDLDVQINRVIDILSPLIKSLKAIATAFKQTIRVPYGGYPKICHKWGVPYPCGWHTVYFSFTIKQILDGLSGVIKPVMDLLNKAMSAILNPLLKALNLDITLPEIPGLSVLKELKDHLTTIFDSIIGTLDDLLNRLNVFADFLKQLQEIMDRINEINKECRLNIEGKEKPQ